jgi:magnesium-transporting ATPase (P-type)
MEFRKLSLDGTLYGTDENLTGDQKIPHFNFVDPNFTAHLKDQVVVDFLIHLACCHSIVKNEKSTVHPYMASSPDELALIYAAK